MPKLLAIILSSLLMILICANLALFHLAQTPKPMLVIIGDSNSDPYSQVQVQKWSELYAQLHQNQVDVRNLSIGGHAVEDFIVPEIFQELTGIAKQVKPGQKVLMVTLLGTNNAIMSNKIDTPETFVKNYAAFLSDVIAILKPQQIIVGSIPPTIVRMIPGTKTPTDPGAPKLIPELNSALEKFATNQTIGSTRLSFFNIMPSSSYLPENTSQYFIADGVHLNAKGQSTVYNLLTPMIDQILK